MGDVDKPWLRADFRRRLRGLSLEDRARESAALNALFEAWAGAAGFEVVLATLPLDDEPDLTRFLASWLSEGRVLGLPRTGEAGAMEYHLVDSLEGPWQTRKGLREPLETASPWRPGRPTLCLVPGLAFAWVGEAQRLGRGGGYFDRWLAAHGDEVFSVGVGFSVSTSDALPHDPWDRALDGLALAGQPLRISASHDGSKRRR